MRPRSGVVRDSKSPGHLRTDRHTEEDDDVWDGYGLWNFTIDKGHSKAIYKIGGNWSAILKLRKGKHEFKFKRFGRWWSRRKPDDSKKWAWPGHQATLEHAIRMVMVMMMMTMIVKIMINTITVMRSDLSTWPARPQKCKEDNNDHHYGHNDEEDNDNHHHEMIHWWWWWWCG